jgi:hypothetical protein
VVTTILPPASLAAMTRWVSRISFQKDPADGDRDLAGRDSAEELLQNGLRQIGGVTVYPVNLTPLGMSPVG